MTKKKPEKPAETPADTQARALQLRMGQPAPSKDAPTPDSKD